jgi:tRNA G18 (ribose-2'-O)-methylase SpoU
MNFHSVLILENIRSAQNVGAIFRTADAIGVEKIYLTGYTPAPLDKFKRPSKEIAKTALGAEKTIPWEKTPETIGTIEALKKQGFIIVAVEQAAEAIDYKKLKVPAKVAFILGNEVDGVLADTLARVDATVEIPMRGAKESLNVATTAGIILFRALDR